MAPITYNNNNNIVVMVTHDFKDKYRLAFARPGFGEWITLQDHENGGFADIACYEDKILGLRTNRALVMCEIDNVFIRGLLHFLFHPRS